MPHPDFPGCEARLRALLEAAQRFVDELQKQSHGSSEPALREAREKLSLELAMARNFLRRDARS